MTRRRTYKTVRMEIEALEAEAKKVKGLQRRNDLNSVKDLLRDQGITPEEIVELYAELKYEAEHPDEQLEAPPIDIPLNLIDDAALDVMIEKIIATRRRLA